MKLLLDVGNTRLKWLLLAGDNSENILCAKKGSVLVKDLKHMNDPIKETTFFKQIKNNISQINQELGNKLTSENRCLKKIIWICVGPKAIEEKITYALCKLYGSTAPKKTVTPKNGRLNFKTDWGEVFLKSNYEYPNKLGADRWAASVGMAFLGPPLWHSKKSSSEIILVSAGTATVIDKILWNRLSDKAWACELDGGMILPGFEQMNSNMRFLDKSLTQKKTNLSLYPKNTTDAIKTGIAFSQALFENNKKKVIVVHGGDSDKWVNSYVFFNPKNTKPIKMPWLIFEGLILINREE